MREGRHHTSTARTRSRLILERIRSLLSKEQINSIGPTIAHIVEADGIVMTSEMEIVYLAEEILGIKISVDEDQ